MIVIANWKAYIADAERAKELRALAVRLGKRGGITIVLAPPAPFLGALVSGRASPISFAAQDISATTGGAHTGEATAQAYAAAGARYAIVGHSERRAAGETNAIVAEKLAHAAAHGLIPVLCVGERERDGEGRYLSFVREQLSSALSPLAPKGRSSVIVAYEPVWAIGKTAADALPANELREMVLYIRKVLAEFLPGNAAGRSRILYGGSVEPANIRALAGASGVDGFLVGHASVDSGSFRALVGALA